MTRAPALINGFLGIPCSYSSWTRELKVDPDGRVRPVSKCCRLQMEIQGSVYTPLKYFELRRALMPAPPGTLLHQRFGPPFQTFVGIPTPVGECRWRRFRLVAGAELLDGFHPKWLDSLCRFASFTGGDVLVLG